MTTKFSTEARGCFGVAAVKRIDGKVLGARATPFNCTGVLLSAPNHVKSSSSNKYNRVKQLGGCWGDSGKGYQERYNEHWEERLIMTRDYSRLANRQRSRHEGNVVLITVFQLHFYVRPCTHLARPESCTRSGI